MARLAATGRIDRGEVASYLRGLHVTLQPQDENWVWVGWQRAISLLALADLVPLVGDAFRRGLVGERVMEFHHFEDDLRSSQRAAAPVEALGGQVGDINRLDDVAAYLAGWHSFQSPDERLRPTEASWKALQKSLENHLLTRASQPIRNRLRDIGRNDPCPCGSGKKFKKCCFDKGRR